MSDPVIINPTITLAGQEAAFSTSTTGLELRLTHVSFGKGRYKPTGAEVALKSPVGSKVTLAGGTRPTPYQIRMLVAWRENVGEVAVTEIGYWSNNLLAFVWSNEDGESAFVKTDGVTGVLFSDIGFSSVPSNSVNITIDPAESVALAALAAHEGASNAHPQYVKHSLFPDAQADLWAELVGGSANAITLTTKTDVFVDAYRKGQAFRFQAAYSNTAACTVRVNGLAVTSLVKSGGEALAPGDIRVNAVYDVIFDGARFQLAGGVGGGQFYVEWPTVATAGQKVFNAVYTPGSVMVFVGGAKLSLADFIGTDGQTITLGNDVPAVAAGTKVTVVALSTFAVANTYTKPEIDKNYPTLSEVQTPTSASAKRFMNPELTHSAISARLTENSMDARPGRILQAGDYGWGGSAPKYLGLLDGAPIGQRLSRDGSQDQIIAAGGPALGLAPGAALWLNVDSFGSPGRRTMLASAPYAHTQRIFVQYKHDGNLSEWYEFHTSKTMLSLGQTAASARAALELHDSAKVATLPLTGGNLSGVVKTDRQIILDSGKDSTPEITWTTPIYTVYGNVSRDSWRLNFTALGGGFTEAFRVGLIEQTLRIYGRLVWDQGNQLALGMTAATGRAALELHDSAKEASLLLTGGSLSGPVMTSSRLYFKNGTETTPVLYWETPSYQIGAYVTAKSWRLNHGGVGDAFYVSFVDKIAKIYGRLVWDKGNQLELGVTAATARAALELHDSSKVATLPLAGGTLTGGLFTFSRIHLTSITDVSPEIVWMVPGRSIYASIKQDRWSLYDSIKGEIFGAIFESKQLNIFGVQAWTAANQLALGMTAATGRAALEIHDSAKVPTLPLKGGALTGNVTTKASIQLDNGTEDSPEIWWVTPTRSLFADIQGDGWRLYLAAPNQATVFFISFVSKQAKVFDKLIWNEGNQLALGTTAASGRAALELHDSAKVPTLPLAGGSVNGQIVSTVSENYRIAVGSYGSFWRQDGNSLYLMLTELGSPLGAYSAARPFVVNLASGLAHISGNAGSATKLATARSINGVPFDGTSNITVYDSTKVTQNGHNIVLGWDVAGMRAWVNSVDMGTVWSDINAGAKAIAAQANAGASAIGSYGFMKNTGANVGPGDLVPGSQLVFTDTNNGASGTFATGTWRCMGWGYKSNGTLYVRVN